MSQSVGGCPCGNIRSTCEAEPMMMAICHCKNCQKQTSPLKLLSSEAFAG